MKKTKIFLCILTLIISCNSLAMATEINTSKDTKASTFYEISFEKNENKEFEIETPDIKNKDLKLNIDELKNINTEILPNEIKNNILDLLKKWDAPEHKKLKKEFFYHYKDINSLLRQYSLLIKMHELEKCPAIDFNGAIITKIEHSFLNVFNNLEYRNKIKNNITVLENFVKNNEEEKLKEVIDNIKKALKTIEEYYIAVERYEWYLDVVYNCSDMINCDFKNYVDTSNQHAMAKLDKFKHNIEHPYIENMSTENINHRYMECEIINQLNKLYEKYEKLSQALTQKENLTNSQKDELSKMLNENGQIDKKNLENLYMLRNVLKLESLRCENIKEQNNSEFLNKDVNKEKSAIKKYYENINNLKENIKNLIQYYEKTYINNKEYRGWKIDNNSYNIMSNWNNSNEKQKKYFNKTLNKLREYNDNKTKKEDIIVDENFINDIQEACLKVGEILRNKSKYNDSKNNICKIKNCISHDIVTEFNKYYTMIIQITAELRKIFDKIFNDILKNKDEKKYKDFLFEWNNFEKLFYYIDYINVTLLKKIEEIRKEKKEIENMEKNMEQEKDKKLKENKKKKIKVYFEKFCENLKKFTPYFRKSEMFEQALETEIYKIKKDYNNEALKKNTTLKQSFFLTYFNFLNKTRDFYSNILNIFDKIANAENTKKMKDISNDFFEKKSRFFKNYAKYIENFKYSMKDLQEACNAFLNYAKENNIANSSIKRSYKMENLDKIYEQNNGFNEIKEKILQPLKELKNFDIEKSNENDFYDYCHKLQNTALLMLKARNNIIRTVWDEINIYASITNKLEEKEKIYDKETIKKVKEYENLNNTILDGMEFYNELYKNKFLYMTERLENIQPQNINFTAKKEIITQIKNIDNIFSDSDKLYEKKQDWLNKWLNIYKMLLFIEFFKIKKMQKTNPDNFDDAYYETVANIVRFFDILNHSKKDYDIKINLDENDKNNSENSDQELLEKIEENVIENHNNKLEKIKSLLQQNNSNYENKSSEEVLKNFNKALKLILEPIKSISTFDEDFKDEKYKKFKEELINVLTLLDKFYNDKIENKNITKIVDGDEVNIQTVSDIMNSYDKTYSKILSDDNAVFDSDTKKHILNIINAAIKTFILQAEIKLQNIDDKMVKNTIINFVSKVIEFCENKNNFSTVSSVVSKNLNKTLYEHLKMRINRVINQLRFEFKSQTNKQQESENVIIKTIMEIYEIIESIEEEGTVPYLTLSEITSPLIKQCLIKLETFNNKTKKCEALVDVIIETLNKLKPFVKNNYELKIENILTELRNAKENNEYEKEEQEDKKKEENKEENKEEESEGEESEEEESEEEEKKEYEIITTKKQNIKK